MGKKYMDTKAGTLESSILGVWQDAAEMKEQGHDGRTKSYKEHRAKLEAARTRREEDIDNDGDVDSTDKYLHKRRKAVSKAIAKEGLEDKTDNPANSQHMCAKNVVHEEWGYGQCIPTMHADPDENGDVAWYDVMFEHGIEKGVSISELIVEKSEEHMHASVDKKKNKKEEVKESYEIGTDEYREYTQELTPGQEIEKYGSFKVSSMKEALAKVWGLEEKRLDKTEEDDKIAPVKGDKTMTGGKVAKVEVDPDTKKEK